MEKTLNNVIWPCEDCEQFLFFLEYLNERAICVCEKRSREQRVGTAPIPAKTRLSLALARAKLAARGFGFSKIEHRALSQISRRTDCAGAAQPCERRTHYKEYPNQLKRQERGTRRLKSRSIIFEAFLTEWRVPFIFSNQNFRVSQINGK